VKLVKENINFERGEDPKNSMNVGLNSKSPRDIVEEYMTDVYLEHADTGDFSSFAQWLFELIKENMRSPTYGDYPMEDAQSDFNDFLNVFNSQNKNLKE